MTARSQEVVVEVAGMTSDADEAAVAGALLELDGVIAATARRSEGQATVTADPTVATVEMLRGAVSAAGFVPGDVRFPE